MSLRSQARLMRLFGDCPDRREDSYEDRYEDWYWSGSVYDCARTGYEDVARALHRRLRALRSMTDDQFVSMRSRRCVKAGELDPLEVDGVIRSARSYEVLETRERLRVLDDRLLTVVNSLPSVAGYAVDQDHFNLRNGGRWYVNSRFAYYIAISKRLALYKEMRRIERAHESRQREEIKARRRAERYPDLVRRIRELERMVS